MSIPNSYSIPSPTFGSRQNSVNPMAYAQQVNHMAANNAYDYDFIQQQ